MGARGRPWRRGGWLGNSRVVAARQPHLFFYFICVFFFSHVGWAPCRLIITPALKTCARDARFPPPRPLDVTWSSRGVGAWGSLAAAASVSEGVNWALIVSESRIWLDEVRRAGPLILTTPNPPPPFKKKEKEKNLSSISSLCVSARLEAFIWDEALWNVMPSASVLPHTLSLSWVAARVLLRPSPCFFLLFVFLTSLIFGHHKLLVGERFVFFVLIFVCYQERKKKKPKPSPSVRSGLTHLVPPFCFSFSSRQKHKERDRHKPRHKKSMDMSPSLVLPNIMVPDKVRALFCFFTKGRRLFHCVPKIVENR